MDNTEYDFQLHPYTTFLSKLLEYSKTRKFDGINGNCHEGAIFHFQKWKRSYFHFSSLPAPLDAHVLLITESGFIPLKLRSPHYRYVPQYLLIVLTPVCTLIHTPAHTPVHSYSTCTCIYTYSS